MKPTEPIRDKNQVSQLIMYYFNKGQMRNYCPTLANDTTFAQFMSMP